MKRAKRICRECGEGTLKLVDADDISIYIQCQECHEEYSVEPDGLGEGGLEWVEAMMIKQWNNEEGQ